MIPLRPALDDYLTMRRALGYKLQRTEKLLANFVGFVEVAAADRITIDLALSWATLPAEGDASWWSSRLTWSGPSPGTSTLWTPRPRCRRPTCCRRAHTVRCPTCT